MAVFAPRTQRLFDINGKMWSLIPTGDPHKHPPCVGVYSPQGDRVGVLCERSDYMNRAAAYERYIPQYHPDVWPVQLKPDLLRHLFRVHDQGADYEPGGSIGRERDLELTESGYFLATDPTPNRRSPVILTVKGWALIHNLLDQALTQPIGKIDIAGYSVLIGMWEGVFTIMFEAGTSYTRCGILDTAAAILYHIRKDREYGDDVSYNAQEDMIFEQLGELLRQQ